MGANADHDLWGQALAFESRYGDDAPRIIAGKIEQLRASGEIAEADFWAQVAECLTDLHAIRYQGYATPREVPLDPTVVAPAPNGSPSGA